MYCYNIVHICLNIDVFLYREPIEDKISFYVCTALMHNSTCVHNVHDNPQCSLVSFYREPIEDKISFYVCTALKHNSTCVHNVHDNPQCSIVFFCREPIEDKVSFYVCCGGKLGNKDKQLIPVDNNIGGNIHHLSVIKKKPDHLSVISDYVRNT